MSAETTEGHIRIAAVGDLHCDLDMGGRFKRMFAHVSEQAAALCLAGDLTSRGLPTEAKLLADDLAGVRIPVVAVLGNHDYEGGRHEEIAGVLRQVGIHVLDGDTFRLSRELGFAGVKGFGGGFGDATLQPWGEEVLKHFAFEAVNEALKLESALARLETKRKVAILHYSPARDTLTGENPEIFAFLGCSRLMEPIEKYGASAALHGHAHHGVMQARLPSGVSVYNVALPLLKDRGEQRYALIDL